jgi:hypothetical protein
VSERVRGFSRACARVERSQLISSDETHLNGEGAVDVEGDRNAALVVIRNVLVEREEREREMKSQLTRLSLARAFALKEGPKTYDGGECLVDRHIGLDVGREKLTRRLGGHDHGGAGAHQTESVLGRWSPHTREHKIGSRASRTRPGSWLVVPCG